MARAAHVVVVGAGIGGVAAAHAIATAHPDVDVTVLEAADRVGGKLARTELAGVRIDVGAESMLNRRPEATDLVRAAGLGDLIVHPRDVGAGVWSRTAVHPMPPTVMGVPSDLRALTKSQIVSRRGLSRARLDLPRRKLREDVSVADFVGTRIGREVVDRLVEPLLGGVYAGRASNLSLLAAAPQIAALVERGPRLISAAARARADAARAPAAPVFAGLVGGVGQLPAAVATSSGATVRTGCTVREVRRAPGGGWVLSVGPTTAPEQVEADALVLAVPAAPAARLLASVAPVAARGLRGIEYASMAIVSVALPVSSFPSPPTRSGFLVPPVDGRSIKAATFASTKWGWLADEAGGLVIARASIGRAGETALLQRTDSELVTLAVDDLRDAVGVHGPLADAHVQRWGGALPQYAVGHLDTVAEIESSVAAVPGLALCGAAYHGVGIPAVIASAQAAARRIDDHLGGVRDRARQ